MDQGYHQDLRLELCALKIYGVLRCNYSAEDPFLIFKLPIRGQERYEIPFVYQIINKRLLQNYESDPFVRVTLHV